MTRNKVMRLWTAIVTAFLALCTALGLVTATATAAVSRTQPERNRDGSTGSAQGTLPRPAPEHRAGDRSLPPTMKQRIHAEAHGSSPACRHHLLGAAAPAIPHPRSAVRAPAEAVAQHIPRVRLQH